MSRGCIIHSWCPGAVSFIHYVQGLYHSWYLSYKSSLPVGEVIMSFNFISNPSLVSFPWGSGQIQFCRCSGVIWIKGLFSVPTSAGLQGAVCVLTSLPTEMLIPLTMLSPCSRVWVWVWCVSVCGVNVYAFVTVGVFVWCVNVWVWVCCVCLVCVTLVGVSVLYVWLGVLGVYECVLCVCVWCGCECAVCVFCV